MTNFIHNSTARWPNPLFILINSKCLPKSEKLNAWASQYALDVIEPIMDQKVDQRVTQTKPKLDQKEDLIRTLKGLANGLQK